MAAPDFYIEELKFRFSCFLISTPVIRSWFSLRVQERLRFKTKHMPDPWVLICSFKLLKTKSHRVRMALFSALLCVPDQILDEDKYLPLVFPPELLPDSKMRTRIQLCRSVFEYFR